MRRQVVKSNATFNAFVVPGQPELTEELIPVSMTRELELEDDMKEYWGFYLLQGSTVTVSSCVRWPGASLIMIKGYKHLQDCAYIGDDSSEELDELLEAHKLGLLSNTTLLEKITQLNKEDGKANDPDTMKRHKAGIKFHDPSRTANATSTGNVPTVDVTDHDPKELREILERLHAIREAAKIESQKYYHPPSHLMSLPALHRHRDANVDRDERRWLFFKDLDGNMSEQETNSTVEKAETEKPKIETADNKINNTNVNVHTNNVINSKSSKEFDKKTIDNKIMNDTHVKENTTHDESPIPATAANLNEISQLRRRYYSAQVYAQTQRALSIPITLILRWDDHSTRPVRVKAQDRRLYVLSEARG
ncbi:unnamed protein product, partial [Brenthis ino]